MRIVTTTPYRCTPDTEASARSVAARLGGTYVPRGRSSIRRVRERHPGASVVVVGPDTLEWHPEEGGEPFFFHPGMSFVRAKRLAEGQRDAMLEACGFSPGDAVVDCTAGLGSDTILFSFAGGSGSRVVAVESELPLHYIVSEGLRSHETGWPEFDEAMRRVEPIHADHTAYLRALPGRSVDVVYFDPMFGAPVRASSGIKPLRAFANAAPVSEEAVAEARRVARKTVVMKERSDSDVWEKFGFAVEAKPFAPVAYGVIRI